MMMVMVTLMMMVMVMNLKSQKQIYIVDVTDAISQMLELKLDE